MEQPKIGSFLKELRKEQNLTQEQVAEQLGVSGRTVSRWETGTNMPDIILLVELAEFYDVSISEIIDGERKSEKMLDTINIPVIKITTEMLRKYLVEYQAINNCGKVTIDNIRRSLSTFFSWLVEEDNIKSPMKRIHKVKTAMIVKDTLSDEKVEVLRDNCNNLRDRAMIDFLLSTGIRVGELVRLNIDDIDFSERECVVYDKGDKERNAYFDAKTKIHLLYYIESRADNNKALFVSLNHPHKFRRTMATRAIEKGMPIEQVQKILGHEQIDTTLRYSMVNQNNVKLSHRKYISQIDL